MQRGNRPQDMLEQAARYHDVGHLERDRPAMADDFGANLHQAVPQRGQRQLLNLVGQRQGAQEFDNLLSEITDLYDIGAKSCPRVAQWRDCLVFG